MGENKGMFDDWSKTFKEINAGFADLGQSIGDAEGWAEDYIAAEAKNNRTHDDAMESILKNSRYLQELSKIAEAAQKQAELAEAESKEAKKDAKTSKLISWGALAFSGVSAVAAVASAVIAFLSLKMPV